MKTNFVMELVRQTERATRAEIAQAQILREKRALEEQLKKLSDEAAARELEKLGCSIPGCRRHPVQRKLPRLCDEHHETHQAASKAKPTNKYCDECGTVYAPEDTCKCIELKSGIQGDDVVAYINKLEAEVKSAKANQVYAVSEMKLWQEKYDERLRMYGELEKKLAATPQAGLASDIYKKLQEVTAEFFSLYGEGHTEDESEETKREWGVEYDESKDESPRYPGYESRLAAVVSGGAPSGADPEPHVFNTGEVVLLVENHAGRKAGDREYRVIETYIGADVAGWARVRQARECADSRKYNKVFHVPFRRLKLSPNQLVPAGGKPVHTDTLIAEWRKTNMTWAEISRRMSLPVSTVRRRAKKQGIK